MERNKVKITIHGHQGETQHVETTLTFVKHQGFRTFWGLNELNRSVCISPGNNVTVESEVLEGEL
jgi:hypothetical protein